jgi:hypothetical protein
MSVSGDVVDHRPSDGWPRFPHKDGCTAPSAAIEPRLKDGSR